MSWLGQAREPPEVLRSVPLWAEFTTSQKNSGRRQRPSRPGPPMLASRDAAVTGAVRRYPPTIIQGAIMNKNFISWTRRLIKPLFGLGAAVLVAASPAANGAESIVLAVSATTP